MSTVCVQSNNNNLSHGVLFLTNEKLCFYESEKKHNKSEYALKEISKINYGKVFRHIEGCMITLQNGDICKFALSKNDFYKWEAKIKEVLAPSPEIGTYGDYVNIYQVNSTITTENPENCPY